MAALASPVVASRPMVWPCNNLRALQRARRNDHAPHKPNDLLRRFDRNQPTGARKGRMTGVAFVAPDSQKVADAQRGGGPPGDAALEIDAFETASQEGGEGAARGEGRAAHFPGRKLLAGGFGELVAVFGFEQ